MKLAISFLVVILAVSMVAAWPSESKQDDSDDDVFVEDSEPKFARKRRAAECADNYDCPTDMSCDRMKCRDPCTPKTCGVDADCRVINHNYICTCKKNYKGDPYERCFKSSETVFARTRRAAECGKDDECPYDMACIMMKCRDPCTSKTCAENTVCNVEKHRPVCIWQ